ncbi:MAG: response regulator [Syntrophobacteraceae bacterium]
METKTGSALVIGAGIGGIRSALDLAEMNYRVFLIDKAPHIGGILSRLDCQFPSDHCGMCRMLPTINPDASSQFCLRKGLFHENIEIMLGTEMVTLEGEPGKFQATLLAAPSFIDAEKCIGCGQCSTVCPVEVPDEFNAGLTARKAVYLPVPHNIPNRFVIDTAACTRCGECEKICPTGAINLRLDARRAFRVLVVDDELVVRSSLKEWLLDEGFSVDMAESGKEAVEMLSKNDYGLMLLDIKMPGMDGVEVLALAKEMREDLPVLMMTAYATVETAVEAMKIGARDYLMKPFDIDALISKVVGEYESTVTSRERQIEVGAVVMATGCGFSDPARGTNTYEYGVLPNVITSIEFERLISGTGPNAGKLLRPGDGRPVESIAWLQCVGSRNLQENADYCSSVCCMFSIKEALLAKAKSAGAADTAIFYMDMRTYGKDFQRYRDSAEKESGVRFVRTRVHSVEPGTGGSLRLHYVDIEGRDRDEAFDLVVLAAGQRPPVGGEALAGVCGIELNPSGFCRTDNFFTGKTTREGIFAGGSFSGLKDISESVIQADSASLEASMLIHSKGGGLSTPGRGGDMLRDVSRELPRTAVVLCTCGEASAAAFDMKELASGLAGWDSVAGVFQIERVCTQSGWEGIVQKLGEDAFNRVLIGACMPYLYRMKLPALGREIGLAPTLMDVVDIRTPAFRGKDADARRVRKEIEIDLKMSLEKLKGMNPTSPALRRMVQKALVVGGGVAGMTAALAIADHGFKVDLIEKSGALGGLARRVHRTIDGTSATDLVDKLIVRVEGHPHISVYKGADVIHSQGGGGDFLTTIELEGGGAELLKHGVAILATGGTEAPTQAYCYGKSESILTQLELEDRIRSGALDPATLEKVAMIQCVGSREEGRNYCSRVCCASALKNALALKERKPDLDIYILYRDIMTYGFLEAYYTRARREGVIFMQYAPEEKPVVSLESGGRIRIMTRDPILSRDVVIEPDMLVLSTGVVPNEQAGLAGLFGIEVNEDGFLKEAEYKWQPVESRKQGVFICGVAHSPRSIPESVAMAQAAAQRALGMLDREEVPVGAGVSEVRHSLCSLCERCVSTCPYDARRRNDEEEIIEVDELACRGCGACAAICPNSASVIRGHGDRQVLAMLDAALE